MDIAKMLSRPETALRARTSAPSGLETRRGAVRIVLM